LFFILFVNTTPEELRYCEIWTNIGRATLGRNFDVTSGRAACEARSATWNSMYQLSICSRIEENHGNPWSSWPVAGPSECKLTSRQQSGIKYANSNVSPSLCSCFIWKKSLHISFTFFFFVDTLDDQQTVVYTICGGSIPYIYNCNCVDVNVIVVGSRLVHIRNTQNIRILFVPHRKHITSPLQSPTGKRCLLWKPYGTQIHCVGRMQSCTCC
jgi:hypothetical protein